MSPNYLRVIEPADEPMQIDIRNVQTKTGPRTYERNRRLKAPKPNERSAKLPKQSAAVPGPSRPRTTAQVVRQGPIPERYSPSREPNYEDEDVVMQVLDEEQPEPQRRRPAQV